MKDGDSRLCGRRSSVLAIHDDEAGFMNNNSTLEAMTPPLDEPATLRYLPIPGVMILP